MRIEFLLYIYRERFLIYTLDEYAQLSETQKKKINKDELRNIVDNQLTIINNNPEDIRNIITNMINEAIDKKFKQLYVDLKAENKRISDDNITLLKAITEQQKCLERLCNDSTKTNVFITGIPNDLYIENNLVNDSDIVIYWILFTQK